MNGLDSNTPNFYSLLDHAEVLLTSLKSMRDTKDFNPQDMYDVHDELSETLAQMTTIVAGWNKK